MTWRTVSSRAAESVTWASPSRSTMTSAGSLSCNILSKTALAVGRFIKPPATKPMSSARV